VVLRVRRDEPDALPEQPLDAGPDPDLVVVLQRLAGEALPQALGELDAEVQGSRVLRTDTVARLQPDDLLARTVGTVQVEGRCGQLVQQFGE
jgi:hypothetical protein